MKTSTKIILFLGAVVFALMTLFPPWLYTYDRNGTFLGAHTRKPAGNYFVLEPPRPEIYDIYYGVALDTRLLLIQWAAVASVVGVALLASSIRSRAFWGATGVLVLVGIAGGAVIGMHQAKQSAIAEQRAAHEAGQRKPPGINSFDDLIPAPHP
jgi:hypothetical protein